MAKKATVDQLSELHGEYAKHLRDVLKGGPTAADLSVIRQFLKDNNITSDLGADGALGDLAKSLPDVGNLDELEIGSSHFN